MNACPEIANSERVSLALDVLRQSGHLRLGLRGQSMLPSLWPGDEVEIVRCSAADLKAGEVALAVRDSRLFVHRVLGFSPQGEVVTRGDAMPHTDLPFPAAAMAGKVVRVTRGGKTFSAGRRMLVLRRALGLLFCYCDLARRIALRLHKNGAWHSPTSEIEFQLSELVGLR